MKKFFLAVLILLKMSSANAQHDIVNHLKYKLSVSDSDTTKAYTLDSLSMYYLFFTPNSDSSFVYANQFINHSFSLKDKKYLILAYARMGFYYINISRLKDALDISLKGIKLSQELHITDYLSALYYNLSWVYFNLDDPGSGLKSAFQGIQYLKDNKDHFFDQRLHLLGQIGNFYIGNSTDSALHYLRQVDSLASISKELAAKDISNYYWGMYYLSNGDHPKADSIFSAGIISCKKNGNFLLDIFLLLTAQSKLDQGNIHDAITAGRLAKDEALLINDIGGAQSAISLLQNCFDKLGIIDSAYFYLKVKDSLKTVIESRVNTTEIQQIKFDQQLGEKEEQANRALQNQKNRNNMIVYAFILALIFSLVIAAIQWRNNKQKKKVNTLITMQKEKVEYTLSELKSTQAQLIQSEKMASLGELTAGIAHEIQNPLNFVNNFSDVNTDLIAEMKDEMEKGNIAEVKVIANNIEENEKKINHHGKRADAIVKGMLQHSQSSSGVKAPTDINALADEYLRLAYHGLRSKDKGFNATLKTDFDKSIGQINIISQDIGRVLLNLYNNAFYAVSAKAKELSVVMNDQVATADAVAEKQKLSVDGYEPSVTVCTKNINGELEISVADNGNGIPEKVLDKVFQPFFTTKPTGQGTGLGLSLSYDIIKAHFGKINIRNTPGEGVEFIITLPMSV